MKTASKWRWPQNEDNPKMNKTSKWQLHQNKNDLEMIISSEWNNYIKYEDNLIMLMLIYSSSIKMFI